MNIKQIEPVKDRFLELSNEKTFLREASFAVQAYNASKSLQKCSAESLCKAVYNVALTGLSLNPTLGLSYLVPRWNKQSGETEATLMPSYQGLIKLITDDGVVSNVVSHLVYEGDEFDIELGTTQTVTHKPKFKSKKVIGCYAVGFMPSGTQVEFMTIEQINEVREISDSYQAFKAGKVKSCVWTEWESEMQRKTVIRRLYKYLPKSNNAEKVGNAIAIDDEDNTLSPMDGRIGRALSMVETSTLPEEIRGPIESELLSGVSASRVNQIINELSANQQDEFFERGGARMGTIGIAVEKLGKNV